MHDDTRRVEIWLTGSESRDAALRERLKQYYADFKAKKYFVAVFESGEGDLLTNTKYLLQESLDYEARSELSM